LFQRIIKAKGFPPTATNENLHLMKIVMATKYVFKVEIATPYMLEICRGMKGFPCRSFQTSKSSLLTIQIVALKVKKIPLQTIYEAIVIFVIFSRNPIRRKTIF